MMGRSHRFLGITSIFFFFGGGGGVCLAKGHNTATRAGLEPPNVNLCFEQIRKKQSEKPLKFTVYCKGVLS